MDADIIIVMQVAHATCPIALALLTTDIRHTVSYNCLAMKISPEFR